MNMLILDHYAESPANQGSNLYVCSDTLLIFGGARRCSELLGAAHFVQWITIEVPAGNREQELTQQVSEGRRGMVLDVFPNSMESL